MHPLKFFTIEQARELLPELRRLLKSANADLEQWQSKLIDANAHFESAGEKLFPTDSTLVGKPLDDKRVSELRQCRAQYQNSIEELALIQQSYVDRVEYWVDKICDKGVLLRDIETGLLDFPCQQDNFTYLLCWKLDEPDIHYWHLSNDGFIGRKPLSTLPEYCQQ